MVTDTVATGLGSGNVPPVMHPVVPAGTSCAFAGGDKSEMMLPGAAGLLAPLMLASAFRMAPWPLPFSVKEKMSGAVAATGTVKRRRRSAVVLYNHGHAGLSGYFIRHNGVDLALRHEDQGRGHIVERDRNVGERGGNRAVAWA